MYGTHTALTGIYMMVVPNCSHSQLDGKLADEPFLFRQVISAVSRPHTYVYHIALLLSVGRDAWHPNPWNRQINEGRFDVLEFPLISAGIGVFS